MGWEKRVGRREERAGDGDGTGEGGGGREKGKRGEKRKETSTKKEMGESTQISYSVCADKYDDHYLSY